MKFITLDPIARHKRREFSCYFSQILSTLRFSAIPEIDHRLPAAWPRCDRIFTNHFHILRWRLSSATVSDLSSLPSRPPPQHPRESCSPVSFNRPYRSRAFPSSEPPPLNICTKLISTHDRDRRSAARRSQEPETRRPIASPMERTSGNVERRDEETCVLRATEREGLSSRTGSMRALGMRENLRSNPAEGRGRLRSGESEMEDRREIAHRPAERRKGERGRPNGASLSSTTGLRNTHIARPPARCTPCTQSLTVNRERILNGVLKLRSGTKIPSIRATTRFVTRSDAEPKSLRSNFVQREFSIKG